MEKTIKKVNWWMRLKIKRQEWRTIRRNKKLIRSEAKALKRIKEYANHLSSRNSDKVFVVTKDYTGAFVTFDRTEFLIRRRRGNFGKASRITWTEMKNTCIYHTDQEVKK